MAKTAPTNNAGATYLLSVYAQIRLAKNEVKRKESKQFLHHISISLVVPVLVAFLVLICGGCIVFTQISNAQRQAEHEQYERVKALEVLIYQRDANQLFSLDGATSFPYVPVCPLDDVSAVENYKQTGFCYNTKTGLVYCEHTKKVLLDGMPSTADIIKIGLPVMAVAAVICIISVLATTSFIKKKYPEIAVSPMEGVWAYERKCDIYSQDGRMYIREQIGGADILTHRITSIISTLSMGGLLRFCGRAESGDEVSVVVWCSSVNFSIMCAACGMHTNEAGNFERFLTATSGKK